jgi:hypothetical protein
MRFLLMVLLSGAAAQIVIALRRKERVLMFLAAGWLVLAIVWILRR